GAGGLRAVQREDRVLEVGFGPGIGMEARARGAPGGLAPGVAPSEELARQATRRNAPAVRAGRVDLRLGDAEDLPAFDAAFDKILAVNSLMFWGDPVSRLNELRALLNPGGRIAIAYQPRGPGSTDETARRAGNEIAEHFANAGFTDVRVETLPLKPTAVVCVLGVGPGP